MSCLYHLAQNPDKQDRLRQEVLKHLPTKSSNLTPESLNNMPYTRAVLKEAMRISPVLAGNARQSGRDIVLDGYQVPEGVRRPLGDNLTCVCCFLMFLFLLK